MDTDQLRKQRSDRLSQQRGRGGKRSYVTEIEDLKILLAWEAGEVTEGHAACALGTDRLEARQMRLDAIDAGAVLANVFRSNFTPARLPHPAPAPQESGEDA